MAVNENITLNRILDVIREIATNHGQLGLNHFSIGDAATRGHDKGEADDEPGELLYPYLWADPTGTQYEIGQGRQINSKVYSISLFCADKHADNAQNDTEILNDTEGILSDIIQYIAGSPLLKQFGLPVGVLNAAPSRHSTLHEVYGWDIVINVKVPYKYCHSELPITDITC
jgi:hypothetical protein